MGKLFNSIVMGIGITIALWLFNGNGLIATDLMSLLLNPSGWEDSGFWTTLTAITLTSTVVSIGIGALLKQDWLVRVGLVGTIASIAILPYVSLFTFLAGQTNYASACTASIGTTGASVCTQLNEIGGIGQIIAIIFVGPLFAYALWSCFSWIFSPESLG